MKNVSDLQDQVATDQTAVQTKEQALSAAMDQAVAALKAQAASTTGTGTAGAGTTGTGTTGTGTTGTGTTGTGTKTGTTGATGGSKSTTDSGNTGTSGSSRGQQTLDPVDQAARVAVDNAAILAAQAQLDSAQEDLGNAVLTAPIDGVVGTVGITKGATASTSNVITILGTGAVKVSLDVPSATAAKLKKGMPAKVTADGASAPSDGTVDSVGILPTTSNGSSTYPVVIVVPNPAEGLAEGAAATVAITLKAVGDAVTVPNSAVTATGTGGTGYVMLLQNGKAVRQTVTTGAVGATVTQIVTGVTAGQNRRAGRPVGRCPGLVHHRKYPRRVRWRRRHLHRRRRRRRWRRRRYRRRGSASTAAADSGSVGRRPHSAGVVGHGLHPLRQRNRAL